MVTTPPRRFRFGLRSLFVVVTVVSVWLAYQANWVRQRDEFLRISSESFDADENKAAPGPLWTLGEPAAFAVYLNTDDAEQIEQAKRLFSEADICWTSGTKLVFRFPSPARQR